MPAVNRPGAAAACPAVGPARYVQVSHIVISPCHATYVRSVYIYYRIVTICRPGGVTGELGGELPGVRASYG
jgi:hypothetical protein